MILTHHGINSLARDPQEYDYTDVPTGTVFPNRVPMDRVGWSAEMSSSEQMGIIQTEEQIGWVGGFDTISEKMGIVQTEEQIGWSASFVEISET